MITHPWVSDAKNGIRFGVVDDPTGEWSQTLDFALRAEALGFDSIWANDHPAHLQDCWTLLSALAVSTTRIRLLSLVNCIYYRSPMLTARMAADVDRLSNGRLILGIGIGDDDDEFRQMNIPYPSTRERQQALEEAIQIIRGLWESERFTFAGRQFSVNDGAVPMGPVQKPGIPILLAGGGEKVTLRQVAQYADVSNFGAHAWAGGAFDADSVRSKLAALDAHCEAFGRAPEAVLRTHYSPLVMIGKTRTDVDRKVANARFAPRETITPLFATVDEAVTHFRTLADAGMQYFMVVMQNDDRETMGLLADEVIPALNSDD